MTRTDELCVNTLRFLAVDMVEAAKSGHPGLPLGAAPMAWALWDRFLRHNPRDPRWFNRDRFVLSAGHGSALLYALLHLTGYDLPVEQLRRFRQWGSLTPGHPEYGLTPGVEATTGPLGQGFATGVGMAMAERFLAARFAVVSHFTYAIVSDGDLMEGVASEAASLAGHLGLGKLIYLYDSNSISIEGSTDLAFSEDVAARFVAYDWDVQRVEEGNDLEAIGAAIRAAQAETERPSLIIIRTHIGFGSPKQDSAAAHGEPLGAEAVRATKQALGWPLEPPFHVPDAARAHASMAVERGAALQAQWEAELATFRLESPALAAELERAIAGKLPQGWAEALPRFGPSDPPLATREASGKTIAALATVLPTLIGGAADLGPSTKTDIPGAGSFSRQNPVGRTIHFGVREHAMGAAVNGIALHGGLIPFGATFLVFSDYMRPAIRLAALGEIPAIFVFTHDSIGLGEDGPTHQPVEHLLSLRAIPNLVVLRPADAGETAAAWRLAIERRDGPTVLALSRQKLPALDAPAERVVEGTARGAYVLADSAGEPQVLLLATGAEVHVAAAAYRALETSGVAARVVSMPSCELFDAQPAAYRHDVLPPDVPTLAIEAGVTAGWWRYVGPGGDVIGLDRFGASAPGPTAMAELGFTMERVVERARALANLETERRG